jgi:hypothetical protein
VATGGAGGTGGTGGGAEGGGAQAQALVDTGLIVRYYIDEAASGQAPLELVDAAPNPLPLAIVWGTDVAYSEDADGNRGLTWNLIEQYSRASVSIDGTKISQQLHGSSTGTIEVVADVDAVSTYYSRLSHIGAGSEGGVFSLRMPAMSRFVFNLNESHRGWWEVDIAGLDRFVAHVVLDTTASDGVDRAKLYINGALVPRLAGYAPPQNELIDVGTGRHYVLGNRETGERTFAGTLYYGAMYSAALTEAEVLHNALVLSVDDDTPAQ